eukprot:CAMPEP_0170555158 /NCGR_PEP_ID=MMETSP0211-20121228/13049_1 /TAXON_ID=311385 /ORGANISM="Pseudokeronopsis sp., Strain OXSARD2" /LENGTH=136 /DNA_ID=CAMNT_0010864789 /DNA_START=669 /DNA_END=1079 /DNA_ORIENTATION=-
MGDRALIGVQAGFVGSLQFGALAGKGPRSELVTEQLRVTVRVLMAVFGLLEADAGAGLRVAVLADALEGLGAVPAVVEHLELGVNDLAVALQLLLVQLRLIIGSRIVHSLDALVDPSELLRQQVELTDHLPSQGPI